MLIYRTDMFPLPLPEGHRFPARKYSLLAEQVALFALGNMDTAPAASRYELSLAHNSRYVGQVLDGTLDTRQQREIGFPWSAAMAERSCRSVGATIAAAYSALHHGCGVNLSGGTHHANRHQGSGFCVFNDVAVASCLLLEQGQARRILIIDLDVHQGNGTAEIFSGHPSVFTFSMHGEKNFPFRRAHSTWDIDLPDGTTDHAYLSTLAAHLPTIFEYARPDIVFYVAGADPYAGDRLGRLSLSKAGLLERDRQVMDICQARDVPLVITMGGGYATQIEDTVDIQAHTVKLAWDKFRYSHPGNDY